MTEIELLVLYALLVLLSAAESTARESLLTLLAAPGRSASAGDGRAAARRRLLERSDEYLLTILIVNNLAKVSSVLVLFVLLDGVMAQWLQVLVALVAGLGVILLVGELVPRHIGRAHALKALPVVAPLMRLWHLIFFPVGWAAGRAVRVLKRAFGLEGSIFPLPETPSALRDLIRASEDTGTLEENDRELISSIFEFRDTIVREVMVPRVDMACIEDEMTLIEAHRLVVARGHSRIPVYHDNLDHIVGVLYAKDLLAHLEQGPLGEQRVRDVLHEPMFVPETKRVADLLREFQQQRLHIAIVVDEYGGTAGLVTIEDLLEEIVGEIRDEYDREPALYEADGRGGFVVDAKMPIAELADELGIVLPEEEEYDTLGGYLFTRLGKVPAAGEVLRENGLEFTVLKADERRIYKVRLVRAAPAEAPPKDAAD